MVGLGRWVIGGGRLQRGAEIGKVRSTAPAPQLLDGGVGYAGVGCRGCPYPQAVCVEGRGLEACLAE